MIGRIVSHYRIQEKLGQGGMGEVYLALDTSLDRRVALKFLSAELRTDGTARERLLQEARSAAILDHPFICKVYEASEVAGDPFIAMEFVEGRSLSDRLLGGPLSIDEALQVTMEVAEALEVAHEHDLVHRDLKPRNIMLTRGGHVKVMDFGLVKRLSPLVSGGTDETAAAGLTTPGAIVGTLDYMSPEQIRGREVDTRSDIFSLGVVLYESLAGIHPFRRGSPMDTGSAILREAEPPLSRFLPEIPGAMEHVAKRMLAKDREDRYQSVKDLIRDLRLIRLEPSSLKGSAGVQERIRRSSASATRKDPLLARHGTVAGIGLVAIVLASLLVWWLVHPRETAFGFQERDWIVISDFENATGEAVFDKSLDTALRVSLRQSSYVNVIPESRIVGVLRRMKRDPSARVSEPIAREIAQREGIKLVLVPSITGVGGTYAISTTLEDPGSGVALQSDTVHVRGREAVLGALDELARRTRESLGESAGAISRQGKELSKVTTTSLEALKQFSLAVEEQVRGDIKEARSRFESALTIDPDFTAAKAALGMIHWEAAQMRDQRGYSYLDGFDEQLGKKLLTDAVAHVDTLTDRERYSILTFYARAVENDLPKAVQHSRVLVGMYPDEASARNNLAWFCRQMGQLDESIAEYKEALRIDPTLMLAYDSLAGIYLHEKVRPNEALALSQAQVAQNEDHFQAHASLGWAYTAKGEWDKARAAYEKAILLNPRVAQFRFRLAHSRRMLGRFNEALHALDPLTAYDDYSVDYHRGVLYLLLNDRKEASRRFEMNRLLVEKNLRSNPKNAYWHLQMSLVLARLGRKEAALGYLKKGLALDPDDHFEAARVAAVLGRNDEALDQLELAARKGFKNYIWMKIHPDLQSLYGHPRFEAMLARFLE